MDAAITQALQTGRTIDITTRGRTSGELRRIEIWFHNLDGQIYITGTPGRRGWYANLVADPHFTFHLKEGVQADLAASATPITDEGQRRAIFSALLPRIGHEQNLEQWVARSPLVSVTFDDTK